MTYNTKEQDREIKGDGSSYDFGARMYNADYGRFFSLDPKSKKYPGISHFSFAANDPINCIDIMGEETFFIHGTNQSANEIKSGDGKLLRESVNFIHSTLSTSTGVVNYGFDWSKQSSWINNVSDRKVAAESLAQYVINNNTKGDDITLVGYSHGGNVAIQAADMIYQKTGQKVNIITIATPTHNEGQYLNYKNSKNNFARELYELYQIKSKENPEFSNGINDMKHFWLNDDGVAGPIAGGEDYYKSSKVHNIHINDGGKDWSKEGSSFLPSFIKSHGFIYYPQMIKDNVEKQKISPLKPVNKDE